MTKEYMTIVVDSGVKSLFQRKYPRKASYMVNNFLKRMINADESGAQTVSADEISAQLEAEREELELKRQQITILSSQLEELRSTEAEARRQQKEWEVQMARKQVEALKRQGKL